MKKTFFTLAIVLIMVACGSEGSKSESTAKTEVEVVSTPQVYTIDALLANASTFVDKEVTVIGTTTHTCKFSGRRCFLVGSDKKITLRVEAKGDIGGFNRELIGSDLRIIGIFRERRLTKEYIDRWDEEVKERQGKEDGSAGSCNAETKNINEMREWMKKNNKEYYSTFFMDGKSYEIVE